ncbi:MAG: hypothetical protein E6G67_01180 [Actinobacteria bacterium]|nr:MAG: hypothetical protein E6G67_01180 [Actinomycetota bacterium]
MPRPRVDPRLGGPPPATFWTPGELLAWVAGIVFTLGAFTGWYAVSIDGVGYSVIGWHTGALGKLVFVVGLAVLVLLSLRATGVELPPAVPAGLVIAGLGALGTIFVLVRMIVVPDTYGPAGRGIGIWISLVAALTLIVAGVLKAGEEL